MSTGYNILYSDPAKNVPAGIFVADGSLNKNSTSLTLVGKNYPSYGQYFETDLVHLLENFAASSPPSNPIEGQLWFDTSDPNAKVLKINDGGISGSQWSPINGVFQQPGQPSNVKTGDIWVDTANQQLKFFNGTDFTIVGPNYSSGTRTGSYPTELTDTNGQSHYAIINYVNDQAIEIISSDNFTPNPVIDGFSALSPGLNISSANVGSLSTPAYPRINGIADSAYNLQISIPTNQKISADSFLRNDIDQRMLGGLNIATDNNSLKIGIDPTFILYRAENGTKAVFSNIQNGGQFNFMVNNQAGASKNVLTILGGSQYVGINNPGPEFELDVVGSLNITNSATINTLYVSGTAEDISGLPGNAVQIQGGIGVAGTLNVKGEHILRGPLTIGENPVTAPENSTTSILVPSQDAIYDIGDNNLRWRIVYANTFQASTASNVSAQFVGNASSATKLAQAKPFIVTGDMSDSLHLTGLPFDGSQPSYTFQMSACPELITNKGSTSTTVATDSLLVYSTGTTKLYQQTKRDFLKDINYQDPTPGNSAGYSTPSGSVVPLGTVLPYTGSTPPAGWLLCNGDQVSSAVEPNGYYNLWSHFNSSGAVYGSADVGYFRLPTLTGPSPNSGPALNYIIKY
jgi:hypothetical protein